MTTRNDPAAVAPVLVLGLGNRLLADDGLGPALAELLRQRRGSDARIEFQDGGTQGLALLGLLEQRRGVLLLDAVALGSPAGCVHVIEDPLSQALPRGTTAHEGNVGELLRVARLLEILPESIAVIGIEPERVETCIGLSRAVQRSLPCTLDVAEAWLERALAALENEELPCTS